MVLFSKIILKELRMWDFTMQPVLNDFWLIQDLNFIFQCIITVLNDFYFHVLSFKTSASQNKSYYRSHSISDLKDNKHLLCPSTFFLESFIFQNLSKQANFGMAGKKNILQPKFLFVFAKCRGQ